MREGGLLSFDWLLIFGSDRILLYCKESHLPFICLFCMQQHARRLVSMRDRLQHGGQGLNWWMILIVVRAVGAHGFTKVRD